jgi:hypothetical protein
MKFLLPRSLTVALAAGAVAASLSVVALAGPPVMGFNAAQEAVRMSILRNSIVARTTVAPQKTPATSSVSAPQQKATTSTHTTGQPNQTCGSATAPETPGNAANARGSAFNPNGVAGGVYAGQQPQNSLNPTSVSQYDVACSHQK